VRVNAALQLILEIASVRKGLRVWGANGQLVEEQYQERKKEHRILDADWTIPLEEKSRATNTKSKFSLLGTETRVS
jgi:hypothetical protein